MTRRQWLKWARAVDRAPAGLFWLLFPIDHTKEWKDSSDLMQRDSGMWHDRNHRVIAALLVGYVLGDSPQENGK